MSRPLFKYSALILLLVGLTGFLSAPSRLSGNSDIALAASDPVIAVAGDIACDPASSNFNGGNGTSTKCRQKYTSDLLVNADLAGVLMLGDGQYECGSLPAFMQSYELSWGRVKSITRPSLGNHEYLTSGGTGCTSANAGAAGYFDYFGAAAGTRGQGYYSFDIGAWHLIALNSNCSAVGGCSASSPQGQWLQNDLAAHTNMCTLAYFHHPLFSSGSNESSGSLPFWQLLYQYNAELILTGHDHIYERFAPQSPTGVADPIRGIRQFIVGSGGEEHHTISQVAPNSQVRNGNTFGVLMLTLHPTSYDWQFVPEAGRTFTDSGTAPCNAPITPTPPSNTPTATFTPTATPGKATLSSPSGAITNTRPTYTWNKMSSATWYYLWINGPSGNVFKQWYSTAESSCNGSTCSVTPAGLTLSGGNYTWWVQTWNDAGYGPWSDGMTFSLPVPPLPGKATLVSPTGNIGTNNPTYTWNVVSGATWYYLWVDGPSGNVLKQWYTTAQANCNASTCSVANVTPNLVAGAYTWWIQTWNDGGYGPWSDPMTFAPSPPGKATLVSPTGSIGTNTPAYSWNAVNGSTWYYLWISQVNADGSFTTVHTQWYQATEVCSSGNCTVTPMGITLSRGNYRWWIQTWNEAGHGPWSDATSFSTP